MAHSLGLLAKKPGLKHMELVSYLKTEPAWAKPMNHAVAPSHEGLRRSLATQLNDFICNCHPDRV